MAFCSLLLSPYFSKKFAGKINVFLPISLAIFLTKPTSSDCMIVLCTTHSDVTMYTQMLTDLKNDLKIITSFFQNTFWKLFWASKLCFSRSQYCSTIFNARLPVSCEVEFWLPVETAVYIQNGRHRTGLACYIINLFFRINNVSSIAKTPCWDTCEVVTCTLIRNCTCGASILT